MLTKDEYLKFQREAVELVDYRMDGLRENDMLPVYVTKSLVLQMLIILEEKYMEKK